jgi:hypothetical protein
VEHLPPEHQAEFASLLQTVRADVDAGVVASTHNERVHYWAHWEAYIQPFHQMDAMLTNVPIPTCIDLLLGFACRVPVAITGMDVKSALAPYRLCYVPSA